MAISRQKKEEIIKNVSDIVKKSKSVVFVNFHGLSVANVNEIRKELRKQGVGYVVARKRLIKRVLDEAKIEGTMPTLNGELAIIYGDDILLPAKGVIGFQKKFKGSLVSLGGVLEMRYIGNDEVKNLAAIPGREVLYGQFVTVIYAPVQQTVRVLNTIVSSLVIALNQIAQSKG